MPKRDPKRGSDAAASDERLYGEALTADPPSSVASEASGGRETPVELSELAPESVPESAPAEVRQEPVLSNVIVDRFEGETRGGLYHGDGVAAFQGGHVYKGSFADGLMHGLGEYTWADGVQYNGEFVSNAPMGHGNYTWLDGSTYVGEVWYGIRHGVGIYLCAKTSSGYKGQWYQGKRHGKGMICYNKEVASWYEGDWANNHREGWGVHCYRSGNIYQGQWTKDVRHGEGTMKWVHLGQQYSGRWVAGIQHGQGTHTWFLKRGPGSQYPRRNEYKGEFVQGLRHGSGTFYYASGAVYSGGWKHNKKHGQGKFVFKNGRIFEGEFIEDRMAEFPAFSIIGAKTPDLSGIRTQPPSPDGGHLPRRAEKAGGTASILGLDMILNIETLLKRIPEAHRDQECRQVEFAIMRHIASLRAIYSFYSSLGQEHSPDNIFLLTRLQFWRLLKDCGVHLHGLTLSQMDRLTDGEVFPEVNSPFSTMLLRQCLSYLVITAFHIYHKDIGSSANVLAECFSKLMKENVAPNAKNVKGPLFCHPLRAVMVKNHIERCWEIYQTWSETKSAVLSDQTMTARHFIWMMKSLGLFDNVLTTTRVLEILSLENPSVYSATHSNLDLELTFLDFFEALLYCAEAKTICEVKAAERCQSDTGIRSPKGEMKDTPLVSQQVSPQSAESSNLVISSRPSSAKSLDGEALLDQETDLESKLAAMNTAEVKVESHTQTTSCASVTDTKMTMRPDSNTEAAGVASPEKELECWIQKTHRFFTKIFFPAYEHSLLLKEKAQEERTKLTTKNGDALEKAKEKARLREQQESEEERGVEEEVERVLVTDDEVNGPSPAFVTPVSSSTSVGLKQPSVSGKGKKKRKK